MTEELLLVKRAEGCKCQVRQYADGAVVMYRIDGRLWECRCGSTVEVVKARIVKCERCEGRGELWIPRGDNPRESECIACFDCLGTGLRIAKTET